MTTQTYRYRLDGSQGERKKKVNCPYCGHKKTFTLYKDYETGAYLDEGVGMCDRVNKCGEHRKPKEYFTAHPHRLPAASTYRPTVEAQRPLIHLPLDLLTGTLKGYEQNSFVQSLLRYFPAQKIEDAVSKYYIGSLSAGWKAEEEKGLPAVFWFIDKEGNIRAGQVKLFDQHCHTAKYVTSEGEKRNFQTWIHSVLKKQPTAPQWLEEYAAGEKVTCLWGEHLLNQHPHKPVALTEAPKSAFIASMVYPQFVWLATTSLSYLTKERCSVLRGRKVVLFPDTGIPNPKTGKTCLDMWRERIAEFTELADFQFSTLLEEAASDAERNAGFDLADYLLRELQPQPLKLSYSDIVCIPSEYHTGPEFGGLILVSIQVKDGTLYDVLYGKDGKLITTHEKIEPLARYFNKYFFPATLNGEQCLITLFTQN